MIILLKGTPLENIILPSNLTKIGSGAFAGCLFETIKVAE